MVVWGLKFWGGVLNWAFLNSGFQLTGFGACGGVGFSGVFGVGTLRGIEE